MPAVDNNLSGDLCDHVSVSQVLARTIAAPLDLDLAFGKAFGPDHDLPGNADQVGGGELGTGALVGVVVQDLDTSRPQFAIELFASGIGVVSALLQVQNDSLERRDRFRPFDTGIVMAGLDDGANQARNADAVGAAMNRHLGAIGAGDGGLHRVGIFGAEVEDLTDFDAPGMNPLVARHLALEAGGVVYVFGRGVDRGPLLDDRREVAVVVDVLVGYRQIEYVAVAIDAGLPGLREYDEFMAEVAADRAGFGTHRDRLQPHPRKGPQVSDEHLVVGTPRRGLIDIEGIGVLHQELAASHDAETRALLVAELPLDMIEIERQAFVGFHVGAENLGDHLLVGGPKQEFALVPIGDAQHFRAVGVVASAFAPEIGKLQRRHQQFQCAGAVLFLAHDLLDLLQDPEAQRQPSVDAGRLLPHHAGAQHQPMRHNLRLFRILLQDRQEKSRQSHQHTPQESAEGSSESGLLWKTQDRDLGKAAKPVDFLAFHRSRPVATKRLYRRDVEIRLPARSSGTHHIFMSDGIFFMSILPAPAGPWVPTPCTSSVTCTLPAFSNSS